ncbi:MAG: hypothetical protein VKL39_15085 [Leptolyngbyaceae bacterium]|nr:hypothetical protein [Leptolyngbyaceae bacterium]
MPSVKTHDAVVKVGEYQDRDGNTKSRYLNVGSMMKSDDGRGFLLLDRTFNPAGVPNPDGRANLIVSLFDANRDGNSRGASQGGNRDDSGYSGGGRPMPDDEIPFKWEGRV